NRLPPGDTCSMIPTSPRPSSTGSSNTDATSPYAAPATARVNTDPRRTIPKKAQHRPPPPGAEYPEQPAQKYRNPQPSSIDASKPSCQSAIASAHRSISLRKKDETSWPSAHRVQPAYHRLRFSSRVVLRSITRAAVPTG